MDQEKIGVFISTLRKEHGMTQLMWQRNAGTGIDCSVMPHSAN